MRYLLLKKAVMEIYNIPDVLVSRRGGSVVLVDVKPESICRFACNAQIHECTIPLTCAEQVESHEQKTAGDGNIRILYHALEGGLLSQEEILPRILQI